MNDIFSLTLLFSALGLGLSLGYFIKNTKIVLVIPIFILLTLVIFVMEEQNLEGAVRASVYNQFANELHANWTVVAKNETHEFFCNQCNKAETNWDDWYAQPE